jgi:peptidoglycan/LPS O-acetylase OafA/YrhL
MAEETPMPLTRKGHLPELDGLRGIAILSVLVYHFIGVSFCTELPSALSQRTVDVLRQAWLGVDLFFVLSGFLIGGILIDSRASRQFFKPFYARRFFRIAPLYALLLIANFLSLAHLIPRAPSPARSDVPWYAYLTFTQNYWLARGPAGVAAFMGVTWSLAVEEQFYLTIPVLVRFVRARFLPWLLVGLIVLAPLLRFNLYTTLGADARRAAYELTYCRVDTLAMGALLAVLLRNARVWQALVQNRRLLCGALACLALGVPYFLVENVTPTYAARAALMYTWIGLFFSCALVLAVVSPESWLARALRAGWLRELGTFAYFLYLFHSLLIFIALAWSGPYVPRTLGTVSALLLCCLVLSLELAQLSWRYFERPLIRVGRRVEYH